jgi:hypothetical protein
MHILFLNTPFVPAISFMRRCCVGVEAVHIHIRFPEALKRQDDVITGDVNVTICEEQLFCFSES